MKKACLYFILFFIQQSVTAQADTFHYYLDGKRKITEKQTGARYIGNVYKKHEPDSVWKVEEYTLPGKNLYLTGWAKDEKGTTKHGYFMYFNSDLVKIREGNYADGKREGEWKDWEENGKLSVKSQFHNGVPVGLRKSWYESGTTRDSAFLDDKGNGQALGYFESGIVKYKGEVAAGLRTGLWQYYYDVPGNIKSMEAEYVSDSATTLRCFTGKGDPQSGDCVYSKPTYFPGGEKAWADYLKEKIEGIIFSEQVEIAKDYKVTMSFIIDKTGKTTEIKVYRTGGNAKLDKLAEKIIAGSPAWEPATQYNQPISSFRRQPLTFAANAGNN